MKNLIKSKTLISIVLATFVVVLGLLGSNWGVGHAGSDETLPTLPTLPTVPTIPLVGEIDPSTVNVGSPDTVFTMTGTGFIDTEYTLIRWIGPGESGNVTYDVFPNTVNTGGTELTFTIPASYLDMEGAANIWVINHWQNIATWEISGPYNVSIVTVPDTYYIYLPLILK